jgi:hypothetical protein
MSLNHSSIFHGETKPAGIKGILNLFSCKFCKYILPIKTKRLVYISTLVAGIKNIKEPDEFLVKRLNKALHLCDIDEAILLPMWFGKNYWAKKLSKGIFLGQLPKLHLSDLDNKVLSFAEMRVVANEIIKHTPEWLDYGSKRILRGDIIKLLETLQAKRHRA